jgi:hypothetical protein
MIGSDLRDFVSSTRSKIVSDCPPTSGNYGGGFANLTNPGGVCGCPSIPTSNQLCNSVCSTSDTYITLSNYPELQCMFLHPTNPEPAINSIHNVYYKYALPDGTVTSQGSALGFKY